MHPSTGVFRMQIDEYKFPDGFYYHKEHLWARVENKLVFVGLTDFTQKMAGTIKRIVTLEEEDEVSQDKPFGTMSSGKWTGKLYAPVSGEIVEVNEGILKNPSMINVDPYGRGWVAVISPDNLDAELGDLIKDFCTIGERVVAVGETFGNIDHLTIIRIQFNSNPFQICRRLGSQINNYVIHSTSSASHKLYLFEGGILVMHPP